MSDGELRYKRILVKISGEALMGDTDYGVDPVMLRRIALEVQELLGLGVQVALVIGSHSRMSMPTTAPPPDFPALTRSTAICVQPPGAAPRSTTFFPLLRK